MTHASTPAQSRQKNCSQCGVAFHCGSASGDAKCWCNEVPKFVPDTARDCLCPACLAVAIARQHSQPRLPLTEGEDYYQEGKMIVFTARHHLRRGSCCGRGCRHCPYQ